MSRVNLDDTVNAIKGHEVTEPDWLQNPYCGVVTIQSVQYSELVTYQNGDPYVGTPYFKFFVLTETNEKASIQLWRPKEGDDDDKKNRKLDKIKKFMENAGVDPSKSGEEYFQSIIGHKVQVVIVKQEVLNLENVPKIDNRLNYWFSKPVDEVIEMDQSKMFNRLSPADMKRFEEASDAYNKANPTEEKKDAIDASKGEDFKEEPPVKEGEDF